MFILIYCCSLKLSDTATVVDNQVLCFLNMQVKLKKNKYNLADDDEEDFEIGASLGWDDFDDEVPFDEDEEDYGRDGKNSFSCCFSHLSGE